MSNKRTLPNIDLDILALKKLYEKSTHVVAWYAHGNQDGTVRGPFCRWFTCSKVSPEYEKNVGTVEDDVAYAAAAMNSVPHLISAYESLQAKHEELLSYLPKVPTEPYEKELAQKLAAAEAERDELRDKFGGSGYGNEKTQLERERDQLREELDEVKQSHSNALDSSAELAARVRELEKLDKFLKTDHPILRCMQVMQTTEKRLDAVLTENSVLREALGIIKENSTFDSAGVTNNRNPWTDWAKSVAREALEKYSKK